VRTDVRAAWVLASLASVRWYGKCGDFEVDGGVQFGGLVGVVPAHKEPECAVGAVSYFSGGAVVALLAGFVVPRVANPDCLATYDGLVRVVFHGRPAFPPRPW